MTDFDQACADFTEQMKIAADWKASYFGAAYSTRLLAAINDVRTACNQMEATLKAALTSQTEEGTR